MRARITAACLGEDCIRSARCINHHAIEYSGPFTLRINKCQGGLFEPVRKEFPVVVERRRGEQGAVA